jgi:hypothetical protein
VLKSLSFQRSTFSTNKNWEFVTILNSKKCPIGLHFSLRPGWL